MAIVDELVSILGYELRGEHNLTRFAAGMERAKAKVNAAAAAITRYTALAAGAALAGGGFFARDLIATGAEFERLETILTTIEGSSEKAQASLSWVEDFAKTTPFDLQQVSEAFVRLRAYGLDPMDGTLRSIGDASSAMGKTLMQGVEAIADAAQGENERLKEFGIRASAEGDKVTYTWQQNGETMKRTIRKDGAEIVKFLTEIMGERFNGAMEAQSKTWNGLVSNMGDSWTAFKKKIDDAGFFDWAKRQLEGLMGTVARLDANGTLDAWAKSISDGLILAGESIARLVRGVGRAGEALSQLFSSLSGGTIDTNALQSLAIAFGILLRTFAPLVFWTGLAYLALDDFLTYIEGGESRLGAFIAKLQELTGVSEGVAQAMAGMAAAVGVGLLANLKTIAKGAVVLLARGLMTGLAAIGPWLLRGLAAAFGVLSGPVGWAILAASAAMLVYQFWDQLVIAWDYLVGQAGALFATIGTAIGNAFNSVNWGTFGDDIGYTIMAAILAAIGFAGNLIISAFNQVLGWIKSIDWASIGVTVLNAIVNLPANIANIFLAAIDAIAAIDWAQVGQTILDSVSAILRTGPDTFAGIFRGAGTAIGEAVKKWFDIDLTEIGAKMAADLLAGLQSIGSEISAWWQGLFSWRPSWPGQGQEGEPGQDQQPANTSGRNEPRSAPDSNWITDLQKSSQEYGANLQGNMGRMDPEIAAGAVITDNSTATSNQTNNVNVNQYVNQAVDAPAAAANAVGNAIPRAIPGPARLQAEPAF